MLAPRNTPLKFENASTINETQSNTATAFWNTTLSSTTPSGKETERHAHDSLKPEPDETRLTILKTGKIISLGSALGVGARVSRRGSGCLGLTDSRELTTKRISHSPMVENAELSVVKWERGGGNQDPLKQLAALIRNIVDEAKACGGCVTLKYDKEKGNLSTRKNDQ
ncbi:hypothetical protein F4804DRAFT_339142 [Jackrogersella minutella]|nr:hypothetical protein F4804DRAFT_339142 [Jackrogersella minutella]